MKAIYNPLKGIYIYIYRDLIPSFPTKDQPDEAVKGRNLQAVIPQTLNPKTAQPQKPESPNTLTLPNPKL